MKYYNITDYAKLVGVDRATVHRWINEGKLEMVEVAKGVKRIKVKEEE